MQARIFSAAIFFDRFHQASTLRNSSCYVFRVPKTGSCSLGTALGSACIGRQKFYLPNTLDLDGCVARFQHLRFRRSQIRNLIAHYGTPSLGHAFRLIERNAVNGDLLSGGHIDFRTVCLHLSIDVKIITMLRNPYDRCRSEYYYARRNHLRKPLLARLDFQHAPANCGTARF